MIEVWDGAGRYRGGAGVGVRTAYAFSFAGHYDAANVGFGLLMACNEERLDAGAGFEPHPHRDTEIVTWVVEGALEHRDAGGGGLGATVLGAGGAQVLSAGGGVRHGERNAGAAPVRFLQMWLHPDGYGGPPRYAAAADPAPPGPGLRPLASGLPGVAAPLPLRQRAAALHVGRPEAAEECPLPDAPYLYVHLVHGTLRLAEGDGREAVLGPGDAARITDARGVRAVTGGPAEYLVWQMHALPSFG